LYHQSKTDIAKGALEMGDYEESVKEIKKTMGLVMDQFKSIPPDTLPHEWAEMKEYSFGETKIPAKYRELIGLAVAASIKCPYCVYFHTKAAKMNGATDEEIAELAFLTRFTTGWSSILHASNLDLEVFKKQFDEAAKHMSAQAKR
jgi:AhpD family alkylhydroperoxidase